MSRQHEELEFRRFITELLQAQHYEFLEEHRLFSAETLHETMAKLCDIIAKEVLADSCTIHLKLYDSSELLSRSHKPVPGSTPAQWDEQLRRHIDTVRARAGMPALTAPENDRKAAATLHRERWKSAASTLAYPYWKHPKGVAWLIATSRHSPWQRLCRSEDSFVTLDSGITTDIVQDNLARIRDPLSIRATRNLRKLGAVDYLVWTNKTWRDSFKNFYGTPIRIHQGGEVIGILKVENKREKTVENEQDKNKDRTVEQRLSELVSTPLAQLLKRDGQGLTRFEQAILDLAEPNAEDRRGISLLALAYLTAELETVADPERMTLHDFALVLYPHGTEGEINPGRWAELEHAAAMSPVVQVISTSIADERRLWRLLDGRDADAALTSERYRTVKAFYNAVASAFAGLNLADLAALRAVSGRPVHVGNASVTFRGFWEEREKHHDGIALSHFYFRGALRDADGQALFLYAMAPPTKEQLSTITPALFDGECAVCAGDMAAIYRNLSDVPAAHNPYVSGAADRLFRGFKARRAGEKILLEREGASDHQRHRHHVIDLLVDRWAARIEALNQCVPIPEFTSEDTKKLCWAALEIGKLVEREISYRANRSDDPIPLTAMEFYRIPISDLSFVDGLQARRADAKKVKTHIDHHLKNTLFTMQMQDTVRYESRVKEQRSYLGRLGERHEGFVRGNLAIWFYLLALVDRNTPLDKVGNAHATEEESEDHARFLEALRWFGQGVTDLLTSADRDQTLNLPPVSDIADVAGEHLSKVIGDTRFVNPPFAEITKVGVDELQRRVVANLMLEGLIELADSSTPPRPLDLENEREARALEELVFRNYDSYAISAASLLCQLINLASWKTDHARYARFYDACFNLRNFLASSARDIEDTPKFEPLRRLFETGKRNSGDGGEETRRAPADTSKWVELRKYVETHDTDCFRRLTGSVTTDAPSEKRLPRPNLYLTAPSIYKRIRNLSHTLWQQRHVAHLDWELGRFDLLGCRLNCLFKSQVFAAYEQLWNRGDPFFGMDTETTGKERMTERDFFRERQHSRQRWLSLRTNYFEGDDYHALQIAALVDPHAIHAGFWDAPGYNLKRVRILMGQILHELSPEVETTYKSFARTRHHLRWEYGDWLQVASHVIREKAFPPGHSREVMLEFGSFLGEAAVDYLIERLDDYLRVPKHSQTARALANIVDAVLQQLWQPLLVVLESCETYAAHIEDSLTKLDPEKLPFDFTASDISLDIPKFGESAQSLYESLERAIALVPDDEIRKRWEPIVRSEREHYLKVLANNRITSRAPIAYLHNSTRPDNTYGRLKGVPYQQEASWEELRDSLGRLRREQRDYLFARLAQRDKVKVLQRIQNYVLLCSRRQLSAEPFLGWTSYDLFYYLRSLVPVEIQIRTMLADTMAEQYHGPVYKGSPPEGTEFARTQMKKVSVQLDGLDKEMEIDFEDYMNRYDPSK